MRKPINELLDFCIINVDKPAGFTSHDVVRKIKNTLHVNRVGHCGTLDPMVTGVLPILINRACKLSNYFMKKNKRYVGKMLLHSDISEEKLKEEMQKFVGNIMQKPPVKSRVKRVLRERNVDEFRIIIKKGRIVEFESHVEAGTYIRKLISDLGEKIGGAHMIELRRTKAGIFNINDSYKLEEIKEAFDKNDEEKLREILIPAEIIEKIIPKIEVKDESLKKLLNGKPLMKEDLIGGNIKSELFCVFSKEKFIGIYKIVSSLEKSNEASRIAGLCPDNYILARPEFVKS